MDIQIDKRTIGVNFTRDGKASACVWAPEKQRVTLLVNRKDKVPLQPDEFGYWKSEALAIKPDDKYQIIIDDRDPLPDPASLSQLDGVHEASRAVDLGKFQWTDKDWNNVPLKDYIIYELHTGTFTEEGTFAGIESRLDYLVGLGVTAIEIMPVSRFPGGRNWGYDGVYPFAVQDTYGGAEGLQRLVNSCHAKGIAVILDVVYNHMGPEGNYLDAFGPYFTDKYKTPWGRALNFDDAWCDGVRRFFIENVLMWFRDFHIDALRMDAVHAIKDFSSKHLLREIREYTDALMAATGRTYYLTIECDLNDTRFLDDMQEGGFAMDAQWIDEFHHSLRVTAGEERSGYYSDFEGIAHLAKAYKDAYVYNGQYSPHRHRKFGMPTSNPGEQFIVFSQNHDQVGNRMLGERTSELVSFEMQKLMAGSVLVSPYLPMLFMGEEYGETNRFQYFISHTDKELVEAVRKGRKAEFEAFHAKGEAPDPQSEETFRNSALQWELTESEGHRELLDFYRTMIALRKSHPALSNTNRNNLDVICDEDKNIIVLRRWERGHQVLCLMNYAPEANSVSGLPVDTSWHCILCSADRRWLGNGEVPQTIGPDGSVQLPPESITIFSNR